MLLLRRVVCRGLYVAAPTPQVRVIALDCVAHLLKSQQSHAAAVADKKFLATLKAALMVRPPQATGVPQEAERYARYWG